MSLYVTTFPSVEEFRRAAALVEALGLETALIEPAPALSAVAVAAMTMNQDDRMKFQSSSEDITFSGWVEFRQATVAMPEGPSADAEDRGSRFHRAAIIVLAPCVADTSKIRLIATVDGDLSPVLPFLNSVIPHGSFTPSTLISRNFVARYSINRIAA